MQMLAGIRTRDLRKVYTTPPPLAAGGGFGVRRKNNQPAREVVALDGLSRSCLRVEGWRSAVVSVRIRSD